MTRAVLLAALLGACTSAPVHVPPPLVEPQPEAPDETPEVRRVLEAFLAARWSFDYETASDFVTPNDAREPWHDPLEDQFAKMRHAEYWADFTWSVGDIEVADEATASVQLVGAGLHDTARFSMDTSLRMIRATARWLRDRDAKDAELRSIRPPRQVRTLTYRLRRTELGWRVYMDWPGAKALHEERNHELHREMFEAFDGSEKQLYQRQPPIDERTQRLVDAVEEAERAVRDRDFLRAKELYDTLLVSEASVPDFLTKRRQALDELDVEQRKKLEQASVEVGTLREIDGRYELRVKNKGRELRSFRLVATYVDADGERSYRSIYERQLGTGESRNVLVHPSRGKQAIEVRLVNVRFMDPDFERQFRHQTDATFQMRLEDLRTNGAARSHAHRVATVFGRHEKDFDACGWTAGADPIDVWVEVEDPPRAKVVRALTSDTKLGDCLAETAASLSYPDAADNRSIVRIYPPTHWWRQQ